MRQTLIIIAACLLGCSEPPAADEHECAAAAPVCVEVCDSDVEVAPARCTVSGEWVCSNGVRQDACATPCVGEPTACVDDCESAEPYTASCEAGAWSCGEGTPADACTVAECDGAPPLCLEACGSDVELGDAACENARWTCTDGVLASTCAPCEGEEPLECVVSCEQGEIYEAACIDAAWDCGDGELLEHCG